jgi:hypothetical protein
MTGQAGEGAAGLLLDEAWAAHGQGRYGTRARGPGGAGRPLPLLDRTRQPSGSAAIGFGGGPGQDRAL